MVRSNDRIVFVHSSDELYGADRILLELLDAVPSTSQVQVWLPSDLKHPANPLCARLTDSGYQIRHLELPIMRRAYQTPSGLLRLALRTRQLTRELRELEPELVYCTTSAGFLAAPAARLAGVPEVLGHVQEIWSRKERVILGTLASSCHRLLVISEAVRLALPISLRGRAAVLLNATRSPGESVATEARTGRLRFLMASRWNAWKGYPTLLRAWDMADSPGELVILGGPPPSGEQIDVRRLVGQLRDPSSVTIVGEVADSAPYFAEADVVLVPSDQPEPFGLVAIEAFARGIPVVASAAGGLMEIVTHKQDGWLYPPGDARALAAVLRRLDRSAVAAAGSTARRTYEERFTIDRFADEWREAVFGGPAYAGNELTC